MTKEIVLGLTHLIVGESGVFIKMLSMNDFIPYTSISKIELIPANAFPGRFTVFTKAGKQHMIPFNIWGDSNKELEEVKIIIEERIKNSQVERKLEEPNRQVNSLSLSAQPPQHAIQPEDKKEKTGTGTKSIFGKLGSIYNGIMADLKQEREIEEARINKMLITGPVTISVSMKLADGEKAHIQYLVKRKAVVESFVQYTEGTTKKTGVLTRAIVGSVFGPVGMIVGASTAGSKYHAVTKTKKESEVKVIDEGYLTLTNKRIIFEGKNKVFEIPLNKILSINFGFLGSSVSFRYLDMLPDEGYQIVRIVDGNFNDCKVYFEKILHS